MPSADLYDNRIVLQTEYRDRDLIRMVSGARYDRDSQTWHVPLSWANCLCLRGVFGERLVVGQALEQWAWAELTTRVQPALDARARAMDMEQDAPGDERAYSYQRTCVEFLTIAGSAVLADEMGCGKTVEAILTLSNLMALADQPALIVCPNGVKPVWKNHLAHWAPHLKVQVVHGGAVTRRKQLAEPADVYVVNWDILRLHSRLAPYGNVKLGKGENEKKELNRPWTVVIADEAHRIKEPKSKQTRALWAIGAYAEHRYAMTGTPVTENPGDFWSLMHFVSPDEWPSRSKFVDRYCLTSWNLFGGLDIVGVHPHVADEFFRVVDPRFLRRTKDQALPFLPPKVYERRLVKMGTKQAKIYKQMADGMAAEMDSGDVLMAFNALTQFNRLSQAASASLDMEVDGTVTLTDPSCKVDALIEFMDELGKEPIVVFAASRKLLELAARRLTARRTPFGMVTGKISAKDREATVDAFQRGELEAILLTMGAGAEGLTLTRARTLAFLQRSYSLVENLQAEDRIHRPGAEVHDSLLIADFVTEDTVEEHVVDVLGTKAGMADEITRDSLRRML